MSITGVDAKSIPGGNGKRIEPNAVAAVEKQRIGALGAWIAEEPSRAVQGDYDRAARLRSDEE